MILKINQKVCKHTILLVIIFFLGKNSYSQKHHILIGTDIPLQYVLGYEFKPIQWLGIQAKGGVLTAPYDQAILGIMELLGTDSKIIKIIDNSFQLGGIGTLTVNFHLKNWYYGIYAQYIQLSASDAPSDLVANYFGYNFSPNSIFNPGTNFITPKVNITLRSNLLQAGAAVGRRIAIAPWAEARFELSFGKNIWNFSNTTVSGTNNTIFGLLHSDEYLENQLNKELNKTYTQYAFTPSFNVYWVFKF